MSDLVLHEHATGPRGERVLVRRSTRRRRSVTITRRDGDLVVAIPASFSRRQERDWVGRMIDQLVSREARSAPRRRSDDALMSLAREMSEKYLGGRAHPVSVTWSTRQNRRWGSCTPTHATIRLSHRLQGMPDFVVRAVLLHELVHLLVPDHGPDFRALLTNYPLAEKAEAFLEGVAWATNQPAMERDDVDAPDEDVPDDGESADLGTAVGSPLDEEAGHLR